MRANRVGLQEKEAWSGQRILDCTSDVRMARPSAAQGRVRQNKYQNSYNVAI